MDNNPHQGVDNPSARTNYEQPPQAATGNLNQAKTIPEQVAELYTIGADNIKEASRLNREVDKIRDITYLGFLILLVMVGAIVIEVTVNAYGTFNAVLDKVNALEVRVNSSTK